MLHQIGAGTLGPVFRGHDTERERLVAVKLFKLDLPPETTHQLVAGLERLVDANLSHPAIATPVAAGLADVSAYLAMDYIAADSLDLALREIGPAPAADALQLGARVASALDHAYAAGFTHGCLHPRDVLMAGPETRVTGIGIGQILAELGVAVPVRRPYTAPERLDGQSWDRRADVFSLAALVHELLWGRRVSGTGSQAIEGMTPLVGGDLEALKRVFKRALAEDPDERHPTPKIFVDALKRALPDVVADVTVPVAAAPPPRNLRLATSTGAPRHDKRDPQKHDASKNDAEPLLPLDQPRFTDVDIEPAPAAALTGPSILEDVPVGIEATPGAQIDEENPHDPFALSWLSQEMEPAKVPEPVQAAEPIRELGHVQPPDIPMVAPVAAASPPAPVADVSKPPRDEPPKPPREETAAVERHEPRDAPQQIPIELTMLERSSSAVWPLLLALVIGAALGFAGGYAVGVREHPAAVAAVATAPAPPGREFTEGTVPAAPQPVAPPADVPTASAKASAGQADARPQSVEQRRPDAKPAPVETRAPAAAPPKPAWTAGRLNIRSTPAGAKVFVDSREAGRTPMAVRDLTEGPHVIRVVRDGFTAHDRRIVITRERPAQLVMATLARQTQPSARTAAERASQAPAPPATPVGHGTLAVESRPTGARVFLDGKLVGTTPLSQPAIAAGDHAIRLEYDGHKNWTGSVRIVANEQARVTASLER